MDRSENYTASTRRLGFDWNLLPFHEMPLDKLDPKKYVDAFASANANCIFQYVKDLWGYVIYNTKVGIKNPRLSFDLLEEVIRQAHARNIRVSAYYCLGLDDAITRQHPEWAIKDVNGNPKRLKWVEGSLVSLAWCCFNSPYRQYALDQLTEIVRDYDADMLWIDALGQVECYCEHCTRIYNELFGREIPTEARWDMDWKQYVKWRLDSLEKFYEEITATAHMHKPGLPVCRNSAWYVAEHRLRRARGEEFFDGEDFAAGSGATSLAATILRGAAGRKAFHFAINTDFGGVQDWASQYRYRYRAMNVLTHGGVFTFGDRESGFYPDGTMEKEFFKRIGESFGEFAQKESFIRDAVSLPYLGIVYSDATKIFYGRNDVRGRFLMSMEGAVSSLLDLHVPFNVVPEFDMESGAFGEHSILILPNVAVMPQGHVEALKAYVAGGGLLLADFETSLYDGEGNPLEDFRLGDVFGLKYLGRSDADSNLSYHLPNSFMQWSEEDIFKGLPEGALRMRGPYIRAESIAGRTLAYQIDPEVVSFEGRPTSWGTLPGEGTHYPAIHLNDYGKGRALFVTSNIFKQCSPFPEGPGFPGWIAGGEVYRNYEPRGYWWVQKLIANLLGLLDREPPIRVQAPPTVEATFWSQPVKGQIIVQLFNKTHMDTLIPVENVRILVRENLARIEQAHLAWPKKRQLRIVCADGVKEILVPKVGLHEVIILECR